MVKRKDVSKDRVKQVVHCYVDGKICTEITSLEVYWSPNSDTAIVFLPGDTYSLCEWDRAYMLEQGWR